MSMRSGHRGPPSRLASLLWRLGLAAVLTLLLIGVLRLAGQTLHPVLPLSVMLVIALCTWLLSPAVESADALDAPALDVNPEAVSPHSGDLLVRRTEEMMHGAGPRRRMTGRALGRSLALAAAEHDRRRGARPLPEDLRAFLDAATAPEEQERTMPPVSRRTLRRWLQALADASPAVPSRGTDAASPSLQEEPR